MEYTPIARTVSIKVKDFTTSKTCSRQNARVNGNIARNLFFCFFFLFLVYSYNKHGTYGL